MLLPVVTHLAMKTKFMQWTASLVAMVAIVSSPSSQAAPAKPTADRGAHRMVSNRGIRGWFPIPISEPQPGGFRLFAGRTRSIGNGTTVSITLTSSANVTVNLRAYKTSVAFQSDGVNMKLFTPTSPATTYFASGTGLFTGTGSATLIADTPYTVSFQMQNVTATTQFTIFALDTGGQYGGATTFVVTP